MVIYNLKDSSLYYKCKLCNNYGTDREREVMRERCKERQRKGHRETERK
jgi:hypothetical protein